MKQFHSQLAVKVCVSSRPWNDFRDAFISCPQLRIETLTESDLKTFVHGVSSTNVAFTELSEAHPNEAQLLLSRVVERAGGVFLWVSLVMKALLESLTDGATLADLEQLLDNLPDDLSRLYASLWGRVKSRYKRDGSRLLLLFRTYTDTPILDMKAMKIAQPAGMEPEMLWLADGRKPEQPERMYQVLRRRLNSRTMGLLEMAQSDQVNYLHRTTKEWLDTCWAEVEAATPANFDAHLGLLRAVSRLASPDGPNPVRNRFDRRPIGSWKLCCNIWGWILEAFYHAGRVVNDPHGRVVAALDRIETRFRDVRYHISGISVVAAPPYWALIDRGPSVPLFGFVGMAAEFGVVPYVRAKIAAEPDYLSIAGSDEDLLSCLLLGPAARGLHRSEYKPLRGTPLRQRLPYIQDYIFNHLRFNHAERYLLARDMLDMLCSGRDKKKMTIPLAIRNRLVPLAETILSRNEHGWPNRELGQTFIVTSADEGAVVVHGAPDQATPYGRAVYRLLRKYGIKQKAGIRELFKEWLEGNSRN